MAGKRRVGRKPSLELVLNWYDAWLREEDPKRIAAALDISTDTVRDWPYRYPEMKLAKDLADKRRGTRKSFSDYIFGQLSPDARKVWKEVQFWEGSESSYDKINYTLSQQPVRIRQELFIHALVSSNFSASEACRMVHVPKSEFDKWVAQDLEFRQLVDEIQWHKKNYFERALIDLIEDRHPGAVIFANRTINSDRGYTEKFQVEHSGQVNTGFTIEDLDLDIDTRLKILDAIRRKKESLPANRPALIDV